jgi:DNA polymerase elongation subunit (family B)
MADKDKLIKQLSLRQGAIKILINSIYGAFGNKWFYFYNPEIAQSITLQGQDMIKFANKAIDFYFKNKWHLDTELHEHLGYADRTITKIADDVIIAIYTDTDSTYVNFEPALKSIEGLDLTEDEFLRVCIEIDKFRIGEFYDTAFEKWSAMFNTVNRQTFKLELIATNAVWIKKKNYVLKVSYEPNPKEELYEEKDRYLLIKGLEPIKASYPLWARTHQTEFIQFFLTNGVNFDLEKDLIPLIETVKAEFLTLHPDEFSQSFNLRQYDKYVQSEAKCTLKKGAANGPKAVMHHNHLILKNDLEGRYPRIRQGSKYKMLYCKPNEFGIDLFAYNPGQYPTEIIPELDWDQQFFILIVEPINRILKAIGVNTIDVKLTRSVTFKTSKTKTPLTESQLYPLYAINESTLEHEEVPEKFWKIIGVEDAEVPEEHFDEYLQVITQYGLDTVILINKNLKPFINRVSKKLGIGAFSPEGLIASALAAEEKEREKLEKAAEKLQKSIAKMEAVKLKALDRDSKLEANS